MSAMLRKYVAAETLISVFMNSLLSAAATWLAFGGDAQIRLWGSAGLALDFIPQSFMVGLMSALMPTLLTRKRRRQGRPLHLAGAPPALPRNLLLRALVFAVATVVVAGGVAVLLLALFGPHTYSLDAVFVLKTGYGAAVAVVVTLIALSAVLRET
jgi:hypothetical protein